MEQTIEPKTPLERILWDTLWSLNCSLHDCQKAVLRYRDAVASGKPLETPPGGSRRYRLWRAIRQASEQDCQVETRING